MKALNTLKHIKQHGKIAWGEGGSLCLYFHLKWPSAMNAAQKLLSNVLLQLLNSSQTLGAMQLEKG